MSSVGQPERATQDRVVALFRDELGYCYADDRIDRDGNSNIKEDLLSAWLTKCGYTPRQINATRHQLTTSRFVTWQCEEGDAERVRDCGPVI